MANVEIESIPSLRKPVLIAAFAGWNDAGQAATAALRFLGERWEAVRFAASTKKSTSISRRPPLIRLGLGLERSWVADQRLLHHVEPSQTRDAILLLGTEPTSSGWPSPIPSSVWRGSAAWELVL
jgi:hypothetical protein